jgi:hypothetical protein
MDNNYRINRREQHEVIRRLDKQIFSSKIKFYIWLEIFTIKYWNLVLLILLSVMVWNEEKNQILHETFGGNPGYRRIYEMRERN